MSADGSRRRRRGGGRPDFTSYYGHPIVKAPVWEERDIAGYLFLGGLAGASSVLGAGADVTGRTTLARTWKAAALGAITVSLGLLVHDLGRPQRFLNMLRVFKPTSPMSVGTWILTAYGPAAGAAAASELTGRARPAGLAGTLGAAALGPLVASYTAALLADTSVPTWHDGHRELPWVFVGSAAAAGAGLGLMAAPLREAAPARRAAVLGAAAELLAMERMERAMGVTAEPLRAGRPGRLLRTSRALGLAGIAGAIAGRRSRAVSAAAGGALLAASACTRFGIFEAGMASARDPRYTVAPQRERAARRPPADVGGRGPTG